LVTAGPTKEYIDPVRFITNKSSGKQGYELAKSLSRNGFQTTLISGPTNLKINEEIKLIKVETAEQMFKGLTQKKSFEIHFPVAFTSMMKVLKVIPDGLYFKIVEKGMKKIID